MAQILNGTYEILELAGKGGMSTVFKARHIRLNKVVAVKSVRKDQAIDLAAEVHILTKLDHPNLVRVIDVFEDEKLIYIVMDYIEGEDLQHIIRREKVIPEDRVTEWFITLADILDYLHSRKPPIIYRDMKPANVILQKDGKLKLVDFGIAREYKAAATGDTTYIGTNGFAAPEQFGLSQSDGRTDIYSLGMTMYYLATGKSPLEPPYTYMPARQLNPDLSEKMEKILEKCIQFNPADRYQSAAELLRDLRSPRIAEPAPVPAPAPEPAVKTKPKKKKTSFGGVIGLILISVLLGAAFTYKDQLQIIFMSENSVITASGEVVDLTGFGEGSRVYQEYYGEGTVTEFAHNRTSFKVRWDNGAESQYTYPESFSRGDLIYMIGGIEDPETH